MKSFLRVDRGLEAELVGDNKSGVVGIGSHCEGDALAASGIVSVISYTLSILKRLSMSWRKRSK